MKVLLVDDAAFVRMSLKKILDDMALGFEYIEAGDGEDAGTFDSAFAFFSLGALALRSRFLGSFFAFSSVWATAS